MPEAFRPRPRSRLVLALFATTAAASLLGACNQTDRTMFGGRSLRP